MRRRINKSAFTVCFSVLVILTFLIQPELQKSVTISKSYKFNQNISKMHYVLIWTNDFMLLNKLGRGCGVFYKRNCSFKNCFITLDRAHLSDISLFDVVLFHGPQILLIDSKKYLPKERSSKQSYIFVSKESSHVYYTLDKTYNSVFNFTWTYKLNSDIKFAYITVKNHEGKIIGPNKNIRWIKHKDMLPTSESTKEKLVNKSIAAAWFVSNCETLSRSEVLVQKVKTELEKYNMTVDIYGKCGHKQCPRKSLKYCFRKIQRDYYFYFAVENSFSDDYVTETLLYGLQNYAVPIVFGGADYKRFMPTGIYINAADMTILTLVKYMIRIMKDKNRYHDFFKWHNHYSYHSPEDTPFTDPYCSFCRFINKINNRNVSIVKNFYGWWNR